MTKEAALFSFWKSFGIPAFEENSVPTDPVKLQELLTQLSATMYITFQYSIGFFGDAVSLSASIWDKDRDGYSALEGTNAKAREIARAIGIGGVMIPYDGGSLWIKRGSPFMNSTGDPGDDKVHRALLNIEAEYISAN